jgi:GTPase
MSEISFLDEVVLSVASLFLTDDGSPMNLSDEDLKYALTNLEKILVEVDADYAIMDERNISENPFPEIKTKYVTEEKAPEEAKKSELPITKVAHIMIRKKNPTIDSILEIRVAVVGNVVSCSTDCV